MKAHTKIYLNYFGYTIADFIPCEICAAKAVDIHHIKARGMGGGKQADSIDNLMALCRNCHIKFCDKKHYVDMLHDISKKRNKNGER